VAGADCHDRPLRSAGHVGPYVAAAWVTSASSLVVAALFDVSLLAKAAFGAVALLWFATTLAYARIRQRNAPAHREWMIRSFSLALFFVTGSLWPPLLAATDLPDSIGYPLALTLSWSLNLATAEWWIRRTRTAEQKGRREVARAATAEYVSERPKPPDAAIARVRSEDQELHERLSR
jgi:Predicted membrane protein (DUF2306)